MIQNIGENLTMNQFDSCACVLSIIKTDTNQLSKLYKTVSVVYKHAIKLLIRIFWKSQAEFLVDFPMLQPKT